MKTGAVVGIQDMGAAGLTCSTSGMGSRAGTGIEVDVAKVPKRETGMTAYEVMLSESQERMLLVAEKGREREVMDVFEKWDLHAEPIGRVTGGKRLRVWSDGHLEADVPNEALTDQAPLYDRPWVEPKNPAALEDVLALAPPADLGAKSSAQSPGRQCQSQHHQSPNRPTKITPDFIFQGNHLSRLDARSSSRSSCVPLASGTRRRPMV